MAKPVIYKTITEFHAALDELLPAFDLEETKKVRPRHSFAMVDGKKVICKNSREMFRKLNQKFGKFIDVKNSSIKERKFIIVYEDEPKLKDLPTEKVTETEE